MVAGQSGENFALKTKNCVPKTRNFVLKMTNFAFKMLNLQVRPYVEKARRRRFETKINQVFDALDAESNGWITYKAFSNTVHKRRSYEAGGNAAEVFFHAQLPVSSHKIIRSFW